MENEYQNQPEDFKEFTIDQYLNLMQEIIECLNPSFVVERIAGEVGPDLAVREGWGVRYDAVLRAFEKLLEQRDSWQGKYYKPNS